MITLPARLAVRNLVRHRSRTLIVGLGVAVGMTAAVIQSGLVSGIRRQMIDHLVVAQLGHVSISPAPGDATPAPGDPASSDSATAAVPLIRDPAPIEAAIRQALPGAGVAPGLSALGMAFGGTGGTARVALWGIEPHKDMALVNGLHAQMAGDPATLAAGTVYLGSALAERLEVARGDLLTLSVLDPAGDIEAMDFEVAAVLEPGAPWQNYFVYLPLGELQALLGIGDAVERLKVHLKAGVPGAESAAERLRPLLAAAHPGHRVQTYREGGRLFMGIITATRIQAGAVEFVLLVAIALSVAAAQTLAVHERRREIGTMAALGTSRAMIRRVFLVEGAVLALTAGAAGTLVGLAATWLLAETGVAMDAEAFQWLIGGRRLVPRVDPGAVAVAMAELVVAVMLATSIPAARASRLLPVEALRGGQG